MFARRLVPALVALAVAVAPVSLEACQAVCAAHAAIAAAMGHAHAAVSHDHGQHAEAATVEAPRADSAGRSCHEPASASPQALAPEQALAGIFPHTCDHSQGLPAISATIDAAAILQAPAIVPVALDSAPLSSRTDTFRRHAPARDALPFVLAIPLRV